MMPTMPSFNRFLVLAHQSSEEGRSKRIEDAYSLWIKWLINKKASFLKGMSLYGIETGDSIKELPYLASIFQRKKLFLNILKIGQRRRPRTIL